MEKVRLAELVTLVRGVSYKKEQASKNVKEGYTSILRANNINDGAFNFDELVFVPSDLVTSQQKISKNDIVITMSSGSKAHVGKVAIAKTDMDSAFGAFCAKIIPQRIVPKYLFYILRSSDFRHHIETSCKGTNINNIKQEYILNYELLLPSIPEQERIVARIEELFSQLDSGVETLKKTKEQLAVYRQAVLKEAFASCTKKVTVESVCQHVTDGDHMPPPKTKNGIPFIMISNIENHVINWSNTAFVGDEYYNNIDDKRRPTKGDVLYTVTGSYGIPVLIDFDKKFCFQRHIALLRPKDRINQKFLFYAMQEPGVYAQATKGATGTAQKTVGLAVLRKIMIPFCDDVDTQVIIVNDMEAKMSLCESIEKTVSLALQQAEAMRQSILKKAFGRELI